MINSDRHERVNKIVTDILKRYKILPLSILLFYIHHKCDIFYTPKSFKQEFKNYQITSGERFTNEKTKCLNDFINDLESDFINAYKNNITNITAPNFISLKDIDEK